MIPNTVNTYICTQYTVFCKANTFALCQHAQDGGGREVDCGPYIVRCTNDSTVNVLFMSAYL
jgi:hypothetical protein